MAFILLLSCVLHGQQAEPSWTWPPLKVVQSAFPADTGMLDSEREEYAEHLVALAVQEIRLRQPGKLSLGQARRMLALALHLSPRNKRAIVVNFQLSKGMVPDEIPGDLRPASFARLLVARGQLLEKQPGNANRFLARCLFQMAADLDPKNEDAVYLSEVRRLEHGAVDWSMLTDPKEPVTP